MAFSEPGGGTGRGFGFRRGGVRAASAAETHVVVGRGREEGGARFDTQEGETHTQTSRGAFRARARQVQRAPGPGEGTQVENRRTRTLVALLRGDVRGVVRGRVAIVLRRARRHVAHVVPRRRRRRALREENVVQNSYGRDAGALIVASRVVVAASGREAPPPPESMPHDRGGAGARASDTPPKKTKKELEKELEERERAAEEARAARVAAREQWPRDAQTLSTFFPAYTLAGRQPFAMFTRPNGDVVRASPTTRPAAICNATRAPASGKVQRELAMFRGAKTWARRSTFAAVERERRLADADEAGAPNDESDVDVDDDVVAGASTLVPTRRLDNAAHRGGGDSGGSTRRPDGDGKDWEHVGGSTFVAGTDDLLSVAENYGSGAGGYMARSERRALVSPETHPLHPGKTPKDGEAPRDAWRPRPATAATRLPSCFWTCSRTRGVCSRWMPRG